MLHLVDSLNIGGTETQMAGIALRMQRNGQQTTVGCLRAEGPLLPVLQRAGVPVVEFRKGKTLLSVNGVRQLIQLTAFLRGRFDVVHAHDLWSTLLGVPAGRLARVPVVIASRRYLADLEWYTPFRNRVVRWLYRLSTRVLVNSRAVHEQLVTRDRVARKKVRIVYNAVDFERFVGLRRGRNKLLPTIPDRSRVIAVLANMYSRVKGHDCLISAARIVCEDEPDVVFLLIGDGPERPRLETQARNSGLEKNIVFIGQRTDIPELLACCDFSVLPSENEAFPNALLESMCAGLPVVATAVGGCKEIIEEEVNGLLVPPGRPEALATAVLRLLRDSRLAKRMAHAGQEDVLRRFSFDRLMTELDQLYREPLEP